MTDEQPKAKPPSAHEHVHGPGCNHDHPAQEPYRREATKVGRNRLWLGQEIQEVLRQGGLSRSVATGH